MSVPSNDFFSDDAATDSSDDVSSADGDYGPISTVEESDDEEPTAAHDYAGDVHANGGVENGISALDMNGGGGGEEEENEVAEREREASISRAFSEDDSRRNAPLAPENAVRVIEAMRSVSFRGFAPDWADRVPEERWVDHLRRLRTSEPSTRT